MEVLQNNTEKELTPSLMASLELRYPMLCQVQSCDWRKAISRAPKPCSQRQGISALGSSQALKIPYHMTPILLPTVGQVMELLESSSLLLPKSAASAYRALSKISANEMADATSSEEALARLGVVEGFPVKAGEISS